MTGFGRAEAMVGTRQIVVELKSLNGKQFDINLKIPPVLRSYESELRNILSSTLLRGTIDCNIQLKQDGASKPMTINTELAAYYYQGIQQITSHLHIPEENVLATILRLPEVVVPEQDILPESDWNILREIVAQATAQLMEHRQKEGAALENDLKQRIQHIISLLDDIEPFEEERKQKIKSKINVSLREIVGAEHIDQNRFEQELIYYLERIDFSEEKTRLRQHCNYFYQVLDDAGISKGKKIGFILQEIGREINTLGSKANHADIQQRVIRMKDELEKAKEQILNIL